MTKKTRIVILGAGPAGLAAAFGLSANQRLRDRYDVTIYQSGWRAGGKCATGREGAEDRIVQNGTHYLFGCYDNTLAMMKEAYADLGPTGTKDFGEYKDALLPRDMLAFKYRFRGKWRLWPVLLPSNTAAPGEISGALGPVQLLGMFLFSMLSLILGPNLAHRLRPASPFDEDRPVALRVIYAALWPFLAAAAFVIWAVGRAASRLVADLFRLFKDPNFTGLAKIATGLRGINCLLFRRLAGRFTIFYKLFTCFDFACTVCIGLTRGGVPTRGLGAIEAQEFTAWLKANGADERTLKAPFVSTWYDAVAAYDEGDPSRPNMSAGVSMMAINRSLLTYKGHFAYQMRAECGDTLIGPIYACLRRRGVKFRFFHRIWDLVPGEGDLIDEIALEQQVELRSGDPESYEPFTTVGGFKVWPNVPLWDQIDLQPDQRSGDMDSFYTAWRGKDLPPLRRGKDFDAVVLAMPVASFPTYCSRLLARSARWRDMTHNLPGVESQTMRLNFDTDLRGLGWEMPTPILSSYAMPFATWEDNGELVKVETWPEGKAPKAIATLFGPLPAPRMSPPHTDTSYPETQTNTVKRNAFKFLNEETGGLWPGVTAPGTQGAIDWGKLVDLHSGAKGASRLDAQYLRANIGPLERYTVATADTSKYRLPSDNSQFSNMMLAGDWTQNHFLIGSVEGAIMSGLQASRKLCGSPEFIPGEDTGF